ncbi:hypothetical protein MKX01_000394 [Papaver californicum]|nr:hypothetical protein MKX01_000394 [Papaver californicum]
MLAGLNPIAIRLLQALENKKLFTLDYHDDLISHLNRINTTETKTYATKTILLLQEDGTLKPLANELSLVHPDGENYGAENKVYTPSQEGVEGSIWQLAKAYAVVNDSGFHQLYTHVVIEPFIIATNRQLSVLHPIHYKPHGLRLLIEDYPFAVDGLEIWSAIKNWVHEYCSFYSPTDNLIQGDLEIQSWWEELRAKGHGDLKDEPWWTKIQTLTELTQSCTTIIWIASALHAAMNFVQYQYVSYGPNRPTVSRRFMPKPGTDDYDELEKNPDLVFLKTITSQLKTLLGMSLIEKRMPDHRTADAVPLEAFKSFGDKLVNIEKRIVEMNNKEQWKNKVGPVKVPYTLLCPYPLPPNPVGLTGRGIPYPSR